MKPASKIATSAFSRRCWTVFVLVTAVLACCIVQAGNLYGLDPTAWRLLPQAQVHAAGVYLNEIVECPTGPLPHLLLAKAPAIGQASLLNRGQVMELVRHAAPDLLTTNWTGAGQVRVTRRMRMLEEFELKDALSAVLQRDNVKERGELELRFGRPWVSTPIADEPYEVHVSDLPPAGIMPSFILRFELRAGQAVLGSWQMPVQARIWREVWVASSPLQRGVPLINADITRERRDLLSIREPLANFDQPSAGLEISENLPAGAIISVRTLRLRPVVQRGRVVDALVQEGSLTISMKAEVLEDGAPGQTVRARNLKSKREFRAKVQNEETILVAL